MKVDSGVVVAFDEVEGVGAVRVNNVGIIQSIHQGVYERVMSSKKPRPLQRWKFEIFRKRISIPDAQSYLSLSRLCRQYFLRFGRNSRPPCPIIMAESRYAGSEGFSQDSCPQCVCQRVPYLRQSGKDARSLWLIWFKSSSMT